MSNFKHGQRKNGGKTPEYQSWSAMISRCENPNDKSYRYYGGRGIKVCERWHKFENFFEDMGERPQGLTLDRWPDTSGDYKLRNCRWATLHEQRINRRSATCGHFRQRSFLAINKKTGKIEKSNNQCAFAKKYSIDSTGISACLHNRRRQHNGWTFEYL